MNWKLLFSLVVCVAGSVNSDPARAQDTPQGVLQISNTNEPSDGYTMELYGARAAFVVGYSAGGYELTGIGIVFGDNPDVDFTNINIQLYDSNDPENLDNFVSGISVPVPATAGYYFYSWPTNVYLPPQILDYGTNYYEFEVLPGTDLYPSDFQLTDSLNVADTTSTNYTANEEWTFFPEASPINGEYGSCIMLNIYATVVPPPVVYPIKLKHSAVLADGSFQFDFTNSPGLNFSTYFTTNLSQPFTNWLLAGNPVNTISNYYIYNTGPGVVSSPSYPRLYFNVTSP
jgi:hypothetical protein